MNKHILCMPHCAFKTNDFPVMVSFYRDIMGFAELFELTHTEVTLKRTKQENLKKPGDVWIKYFKIAPNAFIELFDETYDRADNPGDYSYNSLCITVDNLALAAEELLSKGQTLFLKDGSAFLGNVNSLEKDDEGMISFFIKDPEENSIELAQYL